MRKGMPHATKREGGRFPIHPTEGRRYRTAGWLTHLEYDVLDMHVRMGVCNIYFFIKNTGPKARQRSASGCDRMFTDFVSVGLLRGTKMEFEATETGLLLYQMTDQYLLDCAEEAS